MKPKTHHERNNSFANPFDKIKRAVERNYKNKVFKAKLPKKTDSFINGASSCSSFAQGYQSVVHDSEKKSEQKSMHKWASKVTDRLLMKTKSVNFFRNQKKQRMLEAMNSVKNMVSSVIKEEN